MFRGLIFLCIFLFCACSDEKIDESIISKGLSKESEISKNLDTNSYEEIKEFFKNNENIIFNKKPNLIIFSANNCSYCDKLKLEIQKSKELQKLLKNEFNSYYINISYQKNHNFNKQILSTDEFATLFSTNATPNLVLLDPNGKTLLIYPGFMSEKRFILTMKLLKKPENWTLSEDELFKKLFLAYKENNA